MWNLSEIKFAAHFYFHPGTDSFILPFYFYPGANSFYSFSNPMTVTVWCGYMLFHVLKIPRQVSSVTPFIVSELTIRPEFVLVRIDIDPSPSNWLGSEHQLSWLAASLVSCCACVDEIASVCMMDFMCVFAEQPEHLESTFTLTLRAETDQVSPSLTSLLLILSR